MIYRSGEIPQVGDVVRGAGFNGAQHTVKAVNDKREIMLKAVNGSMRPFTLAARYVLEDRKIS